MKKTTNEPQKNKKIKKKADNRVLLLLRIGWLNLAINFDILIVKTSKNTKMQIFLMFEPLDQKLLKWG